VAAVLNTIANSFILGRSNLQVKGYKKLKFQRSEANQNELHNGKFRKHKKKLWQKHNQMDTRRS